MAAKLITNFRRLPEAEFQFAIGRVITSMDGNERFPEPRPAPAPGGVELAASFEAYKAAAHAAINRDTERVRERNDAREALTLQIQRLATYLEFAAHGDEAALRSTGFELRRDTTRINRTDPLEAPEKVQLSHGAFSGEVDVRIGRVDGAGSYELQVAQADPGVEDNWRHAQSSTVLRVTLRDLNKLQPCWVRARGISGPSAGRWCAPSSIVVL